MCNVHQEPKKERNSTDVFYSDIFTYSFRVTYLLQEYSVVECVRLFHNIEIPTIFGYNFLYDDSIKWYKIE